MPSLQRDILQGLPSSVWCSVIFFIDWLTATATLPFKIEYKPQISLLLMLSTYWKEMIFDKASSSVSCSKVDAMFLLLVASGILEIKHTNDGLVWIVGQQYLTIHKPNVRGTIVEATISAANYNIDINWGGIHQHPVMRIRVCTPPIPVD